MFKIASWNVNSLNVRLPQVLDWIEAHKPDVLAIQETKMSDDKFPHQAFIDKGFNVVYAGQKTYNGVAIISPHPIEEIITDIPTLKDEQRRILIATIQGVRLINLYVPNGQSIDSDKYTYKLSWLEAIKKHLENEIKHYPHLCVLGDFNIAPKDNDVYDPVAWEGQVLVSAQERQAFNHLLDLGLTDTFRALHQDTIAYSWWDYRQAAFRRNMGLRIDHILVSQSLMNKCQSCEIDKAPRKNDRPSDHTPIIANFNLD